MLTALDDARTRYKCQLAAPTLSEGDKTYGVLMVMDITAGTTEAKAKTVVKDLMSVDC